MTFKDYLAARKPTTDPAGDLARLAVADSFPDISTVEHLQTYVIAHYGNGPISDAVTALWKTYKAAERKARDADGL